MGIQVLLVYRIFDQISLYIQLKSVIKQHAIIIATSKDLTQA